MKTNAILMVSAAALALAACTKHDDTNVSNTTVASVDNTTEMAPVEAPASAGQVFANTAAASDTFEIESSKAALATSKSAAIKKFAQKMIDAHTDSTAKLKTAAAAATPAITPNPALNAEQQAKLDELKAKTGADFDQAYIAAQTAGHQQTLDALRGYSATGEVASLKKFATDLVPIVTGHLNMAKGLKA